MNEATFLNAILDNPADDLHRLVLADWLEERDDPRSAWLRIGPTILAKPAPADPGELAVRHFYSHARKESPYPLADLRRHGGNRSLQLLAALALRDRLRSGQAEEGALLWRAAAVAELFAC